MDNGFNISKCGTQGVADMTAYLRHMERRIFHLVGERGVLGHWLTTLFVAAKVDYLLALYRVGALPDGRTVFPYVTRTGLTIDAKVMAYGSDGHRIKDWKTSDEGQQVNESTGQQEALECQTADSQTADNTPASEPFPKHSSASLQSVSLKSKKDSLKVCQSKNVSWLHALDRLERPLPLPLFGEHLADTLPFAPLCLVESEKTALVAKLWRPDCTWLATGGKSCLTAERLRVLSGRSVTVWPDADAIGEWMEAAATLGPALDIGFRFPAAYLNRIREGPPKGDLADLIVATKTTKNST